MLQQCRAEEPDNIVYTTGCLQGFPLSGLMDSSSLSMYVHSDNNKTSSYEQAVVEYSRNIFEGAIEKLAKNSMCYRLHGTTV
ncbi:hypothetical protein ANN_06485 [Periplaneta americana]|uniref:Uncharacterized protein n=1 Tax=Periplaneta americana TaxID=6978 RepID=A0ABQ8TDN5_PERAM|nr:hypothetical protein ANN_06485 [Periplaneta americana]